MKASASLNASKQKTHGETLSQLRGNTLGDTVAGVRIVQGTGGIAFRNYVKCRKRNRMIMRLVYSPGIVVQPRVDAMTIPLHSGHWGQIRPGKCLDYDPIRSKISRIFMTVLVFKMLM